MKNSQSKNEALSNQSVINQQFPNEGTGYFCARTALNFTLSLIMHFLFNIDD